VFALVVRFEIYPDAVDAFDRLMAETVPAIRADEAGTQVYVCCRVADAPASRLFMEIYADRAAFEAHERTPATMRFLAERTSMIASQRVEFLTPYEWKIEADG
jgi:quinol monooxygenase YgiN